MTDWFYLSTGDTRLDSLLDESGRGFRYSPGNSIRLLVKGEPGTGKSMLMTQMALCFAHEKKGSRELTQGALFYSLDEDAQKIEERIGALKVGRNAFAVVGAQSGGLKGISSDRKDAAGELQHNGGMVIFNANPSLSDLPVLEQSLRAEGGQADAQHMVAVTSLQRIVSLAKQIGADVEEARNTLHWKRCLVVVDSVNGMFECATGQLWRSTLRTLFEGPKVMTDGCCFVFAAETNGTILPEEYLTDAVILVESDKNTGARFLTVTKARDHAVRPVRHRLMIDEEGVRIIPQIPRYALPCVRTRGPHDVCRFEEGNLDSLLTLRPSLGGQTTSISRGESGFYRGSSTLLVGPPGTRKTLIALQFIRGGLTGAEEERGAIISFSPQESGFFNFYGDFISTRGQEVAFILVEMPPLLEEVEDIILHNSIEADPSPYRLVIHDYGDLLRQFDERSVLQMFTPVLHKLVAFRCIKQLQIGLAVPIVSADLNLTISEVVEHPRILAKRLYVQVFVCIGAVFLCNKGVYKAPRPVPATPVDHNVCDDRLLIAQPRVGDRRAILFGGRQCHVDHVCWGAWFRQEGNCRLHTKTTRCLSSSSFC